MSLRAAWILTLVAMLIGCQQPASLGGFDSPDPASKLYAVHRAGQARDTQAVAKLVEQLDSDDPAVRMFTIKALQRITGTRLGYNPYVAPNRRRPAVERWVAYVRHENSGRRPIEPRGDIADERPRRH